MISAAGGLNDKAGRSVTITHRNQQDKPIVIELARNIADNPEHNIQVYPGDTIIVRKADIVYVVGDVARPSGFVMDRGGLTNFAGGRSSWRHNTDFQVEWRKNSFVII